MVATTSVSLEVRPTRSNSVTSTFAAIASKNFGTLVLPRNEPYQGTAVPAASAAQAASWWTSALRFLGCTGHAFDMAVVFGDEIEMRAEAMQADFANPFDMMRLMVNHAGGGASGVNRMRSILAVLAGGKKAAEMNFR